MKTPLTNILIYDTKTDVLSTGPSIPSSRRRGSTGAVLYQNKIYLIAGNRLGHKATTLNGEVSHVKWFDCFDPETEEWITLPDAPHARDHFQAINLEDKLYVVGGRRTAFGTDNGTYGDTEGAIDVFDFTENRWLDDSENTCQFAHRARQCGCSKQK